MVSIQIAKTGFGIEMNNSSVGYQSYRWNGHGFWPPMEDQSWDQSASGWYGQVDSLNPTTAFDLLNFRPGYEVVMYVVVIRIYPGDPAGNYTLSFEDNSSNVLYSSDYSWNANTGSSTQEIYAWGAIGVRPSPYEELDYNGTYYAKVTGDITSTEAFTVSNLDTSLNTRYTGNIGEMWVDGSYLYYVCKLGTINKILHDGGIYGSHSSDDEGQIWVPDGSSGLKYLCYVDESGIERHTKNGTYYLDIFDTTITTGSISDSGAISMSDSPNWTAIKFRAADGNLVRLGQGYLNSNMY